VKATKRPSPKTRSTRFAVLKTYEGKTSRILKRRHVPLRHPAQFIRDVSRGLTNWIPKRISLAAFTNTKHRRLNIEYGTNAAGQSWNASVKLLPEDVPAFARYVLNRTEETSMLLMGDVPKRGAK
jgi:hypothetical protein